MGDQRHPERHRAGDAAYRYQHRGGSTVPAGRCRWRTVLHLLQPDSKWADAVVGDGRHDHHLAFYFQPRQRRQRRHYRDAVTNLTNVNGTLFFDANDGTHGVELWISDDSLGSTHMVQDINTLSAGSNPSAVVEVNGMRFFAATDATGNTELWETEGSATTTQLVPAPAASACSIPPTWWRLAIAACHLSLVLVLTRAKCTLPTV